MEAQLGRLDLFTLCSHSDLCTVISKELLVRQYTMYCSKIDPGMF